MKTAIFTLAALLCLTTTALADQYVSGHVRSDGTYVQGHYRSSPDSSHNNNYSTRGNANPYTGQRGSESPTWNDRTPESNTQNFGDSGRTHRQSYQDYSDYR
jgi:hypothetical protein